MFSGFCEGSASSHLGRRCKVMVLGLVVGGYSGSEGLTGLLGGSQEPSNYDASRCVRDIIGLQTWDQRIDRDKSIAYDVQDVIATQEKNRGNRNASIIRY